MDAYYLVLLETSGNQPFIFATNKLKENVGASQLIYECGTRYVLEAVKNEGSPNLWHDDPGQLRKNLDNKNKNPPIEKGRSKIEVVVATSGKAILVVNSREIGFQIIRSVTTRAIKDAPGVCLTGVVGEIEPGANKEAIDHALINLHGSRERIRGSLPSPDLRFLRLPVAESCRTSGLPASAIMETSEEQRRTDGREVACSFVTLRKREAADRAWNRMTGLFRGSRGQSRLYDSLSDVEAALKQKGDESWLGVIHADGNGLGQLFENFGRSVTVNAGSTPFRSYVDQLRRFSIALEAAAEGAFRAALGKLAANSEARLPVLPLVIGGDDMTVVCAGLLAVRLARDYLRFFEEKTGLDSQTCREASASGGLNEHPIDPIDPGVDALRSVVASSGWPCLSACTGVAIVKPHFPFHSAYDLAVDLLLSAKRYCGRVQGMEPAWSSRSVLDFHVLHDSSDAHLRRIRDRMRVDLNRDEDPHGPYRRQTLLVGGPYVLTSTPGGGAYRRAVTQPSLAGASHSQNLEMPLGLETKPPRWVQEHTWDQLERLVSEIRRMTAEEGEENLPRGLLHDLREGLFLGRKEADARFRLHKKRYPCLELFAVKHLEPGQDWTNLAEKGSSIGAGTLFWWEPEDDSHSEEARFTRLVYRTSLADVMDLLQFL